MMKSWLKARIHLCSHICCLLVGFGFVVSLRTGLILFALAALLDFLSHVVLSSGDSPRPQ